MKKFICPVCDMSFYGDVEKHFNHFASCIKQKADLEKRQKELTAARQELFKAGDTFNAKMKELGIDEKAVISIEGWIAT